MRRLTMQISLGNLPSGRDVVWGVICKICIKGSFFFGVGVICKICIKVWGLGRGGLDAKIPMQFGRGQNPNNLFLTDFP